MMRFLALTLAFWPAVALAEIVRDQSLPMVAVPGFDKARLVGDWYEVARSDSTLEVDCHGVTTKIATRDDSRLNLKIACHKGRVDGPVLPIEGVMVEVAPGIFQARFVRLPEFGNLELAVLWAAEDDSLVVVVSAMGRVGWLLSKVAQPSDAALARGIQVLLDNAYKPGAIAPVKQ